MIFYSDTMNLNINNAVPYLTFKGLEKISFVKHAFSTRLSGNSSNQFKSMNLGFKSSDTYENVMKNYKDFSTASGFKYETLTSTNQTHTCNIVRVYKKDAGAGISKPQAFFDVDGFITNEPNITLVTHHADCFPLFIIDPVKKVISLIHAGWWGTVNKIAEKAITKMVDEFSCSTENIICAIGPGINKCCFEVGEEVYAEFKNIIDNDEKIACIKPNGKYNIDLIETNKLFLTSLGILEDNIFISDLCTSCCSDLLFSHRKTGGKRGTMAAFMSII